MRRIAILASDMVLIELGILLSIQMNLNRVVGINKKVFLEMFIFNKLK